MRKTGGEREREGGREGGDLCMCFFFNSKFFLPPPTSFFVSNTPFPLRGIMVQSKQIKTAVVCVCVFTQVGV